MWRKFVRTTPHDDDDFKFPTRAALMSAIQFVSLMADPNDPCPPPPPTRVLPDGDGGIVFEYRSSNSSESVEIDSYGNSELISIEDKKVIRRVPLVFTAE
jgi:hypothetical protein